MDDRIKESSMGIKIVRSDGLLLRDLIVNKSGMFQLSPIYWLLPIWQMAFCHRVSEAQRKKFIFYNIQ